VSDLFLTIRLASLNIAASARLSRPEPWVIASTGVAQYITIGAMSDTLRQAAGLARGTVFVSTFVPPADLIDPAERHYCARTEQGAASRGGGSVSIHLENSFQLQPKQASISAPRHG